MKKIGLLYFLFFVLAILGGGCEKILNVSADTNENLVPRYVEDFEQMLNSSSLGEPNYLIADLMSDDIMLSDGLRKVAEKSYYTRAYLWDKVIWTASDNDPIYSDSYRQILQMNIILNQIDKATGGTVARKDIVRAQARINRAYYYLQLVNLYGPDYEPTSADQQLAVPLILRPDATEQSERATVGVVYRQILKDLSEAIGTDALPEFGIDVIHPGKAAAIALQARAYLYMGDYERALNAAEAVLKIKNTILDYNTFSFINPDDPLEGIKDKPVSLIDYQTKIDDQTKSAEVLYAKVCLDAQFYVTFQALPYISNELSTLFGEQDLRFTYNFSIQPGSKAASYMPYTNENTQVMACNYGLGVPEMMLIKAECLARKGNGAAAVDLVNQLRQHRYRAVDFIPLDNNVADPLKTVLDERRRELFLHGGVRIFDLKRLNTDPRFKKDLQRISDQNNSILSTLEAGSGRYLLPFAPKIIVNNPNIIQNER